MNKVILLMEEIRLAISGWYFIPLFTRSCTFQVVSRISKPSTVSQSCHFRGSLWLQVSYVGVTTTATVLWWWWGTETARWGPKTTKNVFGNMESQQKVLKSMSTRWAPNRSLSMEFFHPYKWPNIIGNWGDIPYISGVFTLHTTARGPP